MELLAQQSLHMVLPGFPGRKSCRNLLPTEFRQRLIRNVFFFSRRGGKNQYHAANAEDRTFHLKMFMAPGNR
jgi:hypothetical protein